MFAVFGAEFGATLVACGAFSVFTVVWLLLFLALASQLAVPLFEAFPPPLTAPCAAPLLKFDAPVVATPLPFAVPLGTLAPLGVLAAPLPGVPLDVFVTPLAGLDAPLPLEEALEAPLVGASPLPLGKPRPRLLPRPPAPLPLPLGGPLGGKGGGGG